MTTPAERTHALALAERLERQADLHSDWAWASDHLTAAKAIRHLAGLPPRPPQTMIVIVKTKGRKK